MDKQVMAGKAEYRVFCFFCMGKYSKGLTFVYLKCMMQKEGIRMYTNFCQSVKLYRR